VQGLAIVGEGNHTLSERDDVVHVILGNVHTHRRTSGIKDGLALALVLLAKNGLETRKAILTQLFLVLDLFREACEDDVVSNDLQGTAR
jgi:hypothetical protein